MSRKMKFFGYLNKEGIVIKQLKAGEQGEAVVLEATCLKGRLMGECRILGYYEDWLIVADKDNNCFSVED